MFWFQSCLAVIGAVIGSSGFGFGRSGPKSEQAPSDAAKTSAAHTTPIRRC
jgi:hypothetical protein